MIERFRYLWRRYFGWFPIQPCLGCRRWYWGGLPRRGWQAADKDYCSTKCWWECEGIPKEVPESEWKGSDV